MYTLYTQDRQDELVRELQRLGVLHIEPINSQKSKVETREFTDERKLVEYLLIKAKGICELFAEVDPHLLQKAEHRDYPLSLETLYQTFKDEIEELEKLVRTLAIERRELEGRQTAIERFAEIIKVTDEILKEIPPSDYELIPAVLEAKDEAAIKEIKTTLEAQIPGRFWLRYKPLSEDRIELLIAVHPEYAKAVQEYLEAKGVRRLSLPAHIPAQASFRVGLEQMRRERMAIPARLAEINAKLKELAESRAERIVSLASALENRLAQVDAAARFGYTNYTLLISGWVPQDEYARFERALRERFSEIIVRKDIEKFSHEEIPVAFKNNPYSKPYEAFMSILGLPQYGTLDPVPYISLFFPLFFGIMVGDIGFGLVLLSLVFWAKRKFGKRSELLDNALTVGVHAAIVSVLFGIVFGELFGMIMKWPHFARAEATIPFLIFSIAIGVVHVFLGFVLGVINALRTYHKKHALARVATMVMLIGLGLLVGVLAGALPPSIKTPGLILLIVAAPLLLYGGGLIGVLEIFGAVTNIFSYARLMGFGLAGVVLAETINNLAGAVGPLALGVLIAIVLHVPNFAIHLFSSTIQSARLHYVEFFQKFLELGGKPYQPFCERRL